MLGHCFFFSAEWDIKVTRPNQRLHPADSFHALLARFMTAFWFLGTATYVKHSSECPMQINWKLELTLLLDLFPAFPAAAA